MHGCEVSQFLHMYLHVPNFLGVWGYVAWVSVTMCLGVVCVAVWDAGFVGMCIRGCSCGVWALGCEAVECGFRLCACGRAGCVDGFVGVCMCGQACVMLRAVCLCARGCPVGAPLLSLPTRPRLVCCCRLGPGARMRS